MGYFFIENVHNVKKDKNRKKKNLKLQLHPSYIEAV